MYINVSCNLTVTLWLESIVKIPIPLLSRADGLVWVRDKKGFFFFSITTLDYQGQSFIANVVDSWRNCGGSLNCTEALKVFIWEIAVGDLACQRQICKVMCPRGPIFWMHPFVIKRKNSKRCLLLKINGLVLALVSTWMLSLIFLL